METAFWNNKQVSLYYENECVLGNFEVVTPSVYWRNVEGCSFQSTEKPLLITALVNAKQGRQRNVGNKSGGAKSEWHTPAPGRL